MPADHRTGRAGTMTALGFENVTIDSCRHDKDGRPCERYRGKNHHEKRCGRGDVEISDEHGICPRFTWHADRAPWTPIAEGLPGGPVRAAVQTVVTSV